MVVVNQKEGLGKRNEMSAGTCKDWWRMFTPIGLAHLIGMQVEISFPAPTAKVADKDNGFKQKTKKATR